MQGTVGPGGRQARPLFRAPDLLTLARLPLAVAFVVSGPGWRLVVLALASLSDVVDGAWARRIGGSRAGVVLDPVVDKLFMVAAFWVVWRSGPLAPVEIVAVLLRDLVAALGFAAIAVLGRPPALPARAGGKLVTTGQVLTLVAYVAESDLVRPLAWATAAMGIYAIADYGRTAWRRPLRGR